MSTAPSRVLPAARPAERGAPDRSPDHRLDRSPDRAVDEGLDGAIDGAPYGRIGRRLIPFLLVCYLAALIDRLNLGFAKLQFLADLHLDEAVYGVAAGVLYLGYVIFEVPSNLLLTRIGIRRTLLRIMVLWGLFTMALAFAGDRYAFYALRFLLGAAEAGFFPGVVLYLTLWFPQARRGRVLSLFAVGVPLSGVVAGPLSGLIMAHMGGVAGLRGWQWLFLAEGLPAIALGVAAFFYLPDGPGEARFLSDRERERVARDLAADRAAAPAPGRGWREPRVAALAFVYFAFYALQGLLLLWVPTLLKAAGVRDLVEIGWRAGAVSLAGALGMVALGFSSDRTGERRLHLVGAGAAGALLFVALPLAAGSPDATVLLLGAAAACVFGFLALFWTTASGLMAGATAGGGSGREAAVGIAFVSSVGAVGSFLSPTFIGWTREATGSFTGAVDALAALMLVAMAVLWRTLSRPGFEAATSPSTSPAKM